MKIRLKPIEIEVRSKDGPHYLVDMGSDLGLHYVPEEWAEPVDDSWPPISFDIELLPARLPVEGIAERPSGTLYQVRISDDAVSWIPDAWCKRIPRGTRPTIPPGTLCLFWNFLKGPEYTFTARLRQTHRTDDGKLLYEAKNGVYFLNARPVEPEDLARWSGSWEER